MLENKVQFTHAYKQRFLSLLSKSIEDATLIDKYVVLASLVRDELSEKWVDTNSFYLKNVERQVYYFSLEFLIGKFLATNLQYLGVEDVCRDGLAELGISLDQLIECEPDAGLGNGGLGRLAACFLDSLASCGFPGHGCGIRYKYGLFRQQIVDGYQVELPDNWLRLSNPWEVRKPDKAVVVRFYGHVQTEIDEKGSARFTHHNFLPVLAVPYDMPIMGFKNQTVNTLRLWSAESVEESFDFASFSRGDYSQAISKKYSVESISEVLYPDDSNYANRVLRLKQQYFFVSAGLQSIVRRFKLQQNDLSMLPDMVAIHINDTHPALAVPELMRILMDEEGYGWDEAWNMTTRIIAYTNHTIMQEALETWPVDVFSELMPRIYMIVEEINRRFCQELYDRYPGDQWRVHNMAIIVNGVVKMAHLAVVGSFSVNGVAAVHSELLKHVVMRDFYDYYPSKFNNKTNGITHRRWLLKANPELATLVTETIGETWIDDPTELRFFRKFQGDTGVYDQMMKIKRLNKERLAQYVQESTGVRLDPESIFDVQVKRIHAYKRQLLNALHIHSLYNQLRENPDLEMVPRTFIFSGKAAPSYHFAKTIIKYINELANLVNNDRRVRRKMRVVFLENYSVGLAERIFPASEVSEQISTASKEASGTGNMKFMMNGAVTLGTNDGANIEIRQLVGDDNFILFGLSVDEVLQYAGGGYNSVSVYQGDPRLQQVFNQLMTGELFPHVPPESFTSIVRALLEYNDEFYVLKDFSSYMEAHEKIDTLYRDPNAWNGMSLTNIAMSGNFSSDNTIRQYASEIWKIRSCTPE
jgi:starch phosphorylase